MNLVWDRSASCVWPEGFKKVKAQLQQREKRFPAAEGS